MDPFLIVILVLVYNLSWLIARRRGFTGATVLIGWVAVAAAWMAISQGTLATIAAVLAAAAAWGVRGHWFHFLERPGIHCYELGGRLRLAGLGYGAVLNVEVPGAPAILGGRLAVWIDGVGGDKLDVRRLIELRRLIEGASRVQLRELRRRAGHLVARVDVDGKDVAALLAARDASRLAEEATPGLGAAAR